jgi:hypothetical protein
MWKIVMRVIMTCFVLLILFYVVTEPTHAARYVRDWYNGLHGAASSIARFANSF